MNFTKINQLHLKQLLSMLSQQIQDATYYSDSKLYYKNLNEKKKYS
jgi:hypothetical protein